jgi:hypothetical protein
MGKPKYNTHVKPYLNDISTWRKNGLTEEEIYTRLGISNYAWYKYKNEHNELNETIKNGDQNLIFELEKTLYKKALGYQFTETKTIYQENAKGNVNKKIETTIKSVIPSDTALIFSLTNLKPKKWKHKREMELNSDDIKININYNDGDDDK